MNRVQCRSFLLSLLTLGLVTSLFQNCSSPVRFGKIEANEFSSETTELDSDLDSSSESDSPQKYKTVQRFTTVTTGTDPNLDILWVIDNSGSMSEEADHVQRNLDSFVNHLSSSANIKMALISMPEAYSGWRKYGVTLSNEALSAGMIQIPHYVHSDSPLEDILSHQSELKNYFRPSAAKAFIIVTDDNSRISSDTFIDRLHSELSVNLKVYGFIAFDRDTSPCRADEGRVYQELINQTDGSAYNICEEDWSDHFNDLMNRVGAQVGNNIFKMKHSPIDMTLVTLNGQSLYPSQYSIRGDILAIDHSMLQEIGTYTVEVIYTHH